MLISYGICMNEYEIVYVCKISISSIFALCLFILLLLYYNSEGNLALFSPLHLFDSRTMHFVLTLRFYI